jgi:phage terminase large subunit-like protein
MRRLLALWDSGAEISEDAFLPTDEQIRFTLWWYAIDETGKFTFREGVFRRLKGHGKDPFCAALALAELCGPVAFSHFDENGEPVGKQRHSAWIQVAAVSQDQTNNTFGLFPVMISKKLKTTYGLEVNKTIIYAEGGRKIQAVTSSPSSLEGNRPTLVIRNETQWWGVGADGGVNEGHSLAGVLRGNVAKIPEARTLSICNAHVPGNDTVAEKDYQNYLDVEAGKAVDTKVLYDALEAPADTPISEIPSEKEDPEGFKEGLERLRKGIEIASGDSYWLPLDELVMATLDANTEVTESRRKYLNQVNAAEDSWISPAEWDNCYPKDGPPPPLTKGDRIALGFDGSKSSDHTALCACRIEDGALFLIKTWVPQNYPSGEVPREDVDAYVRSIFEKYDVVAFRADVKEFEAYVDKWGQDFRRTLKVNASPNNPVAFDMRGQQKKFALDCERFLDAVLEREVVHDGNRVLRQHVTNAHRHPTTFDAISIRKASKESSRKIDAAVAAVLCWGARQEFLMSKRNTGRGAAVFR